MRRFFILPLCCVILISCSGNSKGAPNAPDITVKLRETVDSIVVLKSKRQMHVYHSQKLLKTYNVCLGSSPVGPKHFRNDRKTPEGIYHIDGKNPYSHYHKALGISYPSAADMQYARRHGKPAGGDVKIHGLPNGSALKPDELVTDDWTWGCIAVNDVEIDELYTYVTVGTPINILP